MTFSWTVDHYGSPFRGRASNAAASAGSARGCDGKRIKRNSLLVAATTVAPSLGVIVFRRRDEIEAASNRRDKFFRLTMTMTICFVCRIKSSVQ
jgi:hypothetical protein